LLQAIPSTNRMAQKSLEKGKGLEAWMMGNLMYITKKATPLEAYDIFLELNEKNIHSELVKQEVLLITGRNDHFVPYKMHDLQLKALINAQSVTDIVFTKESQGQNHCQIGNIGLLLDKMIDWLDEKRGK